MIKASSFISQPHPQRSFGISRTRHAHRFRWDGSNFLGIHRHGDSPSSIRPMHLVCCPFSPSYHVFPFSTFAFIRQQSLVNPPHSILFRVRHRYVTTVYKIARIDVTLFLIPSPSGNSLLSNILNTIPQADDYLLHLQCSGYCEYVTRNSNTNCPQEGIGENPSQ